MYDGSYASYRNGGVVLCRASAYIVVWQSVSWPWRGLRRLHSWVHAEKGWLAEPKSRRSVTLDCKWHAHVRCTYLLHSTLQLTPIGI